MARQKLSDALFAAVGPTLPGTLIRVNHTDGTPSTVYEHEHTFSAMTQPVKAGFSGSPNGWIEVNASYQIAYTQPGGTLATVLVQPAFAGAGSRRASPNIELGPNGAGTNGTPMCARVFPSNAGTLGGADVRFNSKQRYIAFFDTTSVTVEWNNYSMSGGVGDVLTNLGNASVKVAIEYPTGSGKFFEGWTLSASRTAIVEPGAKMTWEVAVPIRGGQLFDVRMFASPGAGTQLPLTLVPANITGCGNTHTTTDTDQTLNSGYSYTAEAVTSTLAASGILGAPASPLPIIGIYAGDSIAQGTGDSQNDLFGATWGFLERALVAAGLPHVNIARASDFTSTPQGVNGKYRRQKLLRGLTDIILEAGSNDIALNGNFDVPNADTIIDTVITNIYDCAALASRVWLMTSCPRTNPGAHATNTLFARAAWNQWHRDGCPLDVTTRAKVAPGVQGTNIARCLVLNPDKSIRSLPSGPAHPVGGGGVMDPGRTVESGGVDSNAWITGYDNGDLTHPSPTGAAIAAAAIDTSRFTAAAGGTL